MQLLLIFCDASQPQQHSASSLNLIIHRVVGTILVMDLRRMVTLVSIPQRETRDMDRQSIFSVFADLSHQVIKMPKL